MKICCYISLTPPPGIAYKHPNAAETPDVSEHLRGVFYRLDADISFIDIVFYGREVRAAVKSAVCHFLDVTYVFLAGLLAGECSFLEVTQWAFRPVD